MKRRTLLRLAALGSAASLGPATASAQFFGLGTKRISLVATVVAPDGQPIEGATVILGLPRIGYGRDDVSIEGLTDRQGRISLSGRSEGMIHIYALKAGYYINRSPRYYDDSPVPGVLEESGKLTLTLQLFPIRNPAPFRKRYLQLAKLPAFGTPFSYDVEVGDWTPPHGRGVSADFTFLVQGHYKEYEDFEQDVILTFGNMDDGIMPTVMFSNHGSDLKYPYLAPESGYSPSFRWYRKNTPAGDRIEIPKIDQNRAYIFRVRSERDADGNIIRAMYGVVHGEITVGGNPTAGRWIMFTTIANPDRTRNLEFDLNKIYGVAPNLRDPAAGTNR
jgi:hypothetical protein